MKKFFAIAALLVATLSVSAQDYNWAVGLRGGLFNGITAKKIINNNAIEAGVALYSRAVSIDAVYEWQQPVIGEGFHLYYGAGAYTNLSNHYFGLGAEGVLGLEYRIPINFPLAVSLDYRPAINVIGGVHPVFVNFGFGVKYCF
jgi:hypothetical protein